MTSNATPEPVRRARHEETYEQYRRWAPGPLMTREQWEADRELARTDWDAWRKLHGV